MSCVADTLADKDVVRPAKTTMHSTVLVAHTLTPEQKEEEKLIKEKINTDKRSGG